MPNDYFVYKSGVPCRIITDGLAPYGVLAPCAEGETPEPLGQNYAQGKLRAKRAIARTLKVAEIWRKSVLSDWAKVKRVTDPGVFTIEKRPTK